MANTTDAILAEAWSSPERIALRGPAGQAWTYRTLVDRIGAVATLLRRADVRPGDRVLLVAPTSPEFAAAYYGIHAAGCIAVTVNTMSPQPELEYYAKDSDARLVLSWHESAAAPRAAADALGVPWRALRPDLADLPGRTGTIAVHPSADGDTASILYTSGTTGRPKGAELTHGNFTACASLFRHVHDIGPDDRAGTALPLFHVYGQACLTTMLHAGASLSLLPRFDAGELLAAQRRDRLTFLAGVPTMWNAILHAAAPEPGQQNLAGLRHALSGGASLPAEVLRAFENRFGCTVVEAYGLTESTGAATYQTARRNKPGTVGRALPGCAVSVCDDDGNELPSGEVGEVRLRGPVVMKGYWRRPEATAEAFADGWLRTGDLGVMDPEGNLRIVDRKKDLVIRGGYNVYPGEVEAVLYQHPDIVEAAVLGVPDDTYGEEVAAVIALRPGAELAAAELRAWAKKRLSAYKVPHIVSIVDELPKGATGKILKSGIDRAALASLA
ncbi:AMP-binding protein [Amycolatopsis sp. Poz14]|uniref:AMP-binding protein n=1 Tax=Amycolatopsis sp. Poz14 TaxID=1447705 RepID=UPI001EE7DC8D|nr:AMP-binding protein [Amycolatopsis sp. Poz14]MCG3751954.1 AMP-binding protein [Amycolatopsis sp. Poz14]